MVNSGFFGSIGNNRNGSGSGRQIPPVTNYGEHLPNYSRLGQQQQGGIQSPNTQFSYANSNLDDQWQNRPPINVIITNAVPISSISPLPNPAVTNNHPITSEGQTHTQMNTSVLNAQTFGPVGPNRQRYGVWVDRSKPKHVKNAHFEESSGATYNNGATLRPQGNNLMNNVEKPFVGVGLENPTARPPNLINNNVIINNSPTPTMQNSSTGNRPIIRHGKNKVKTNNSGFDAQSDFTPVGPTDQRFGVWKPVPVVKAYGESNGTSNSGATLKPQRLNHPRNKVDEPFSGLDFENQPVRPASLKNNNVINNDVTPIPKGSRVNPTPNTSYGQNQVKNSGFDGQSLETVGLSSNQNGFSNNQTQYRPVIYRETTYKTRVVLEPQGNFMNQFLLSDPGSDNANTTIETDDINPSGINDSNMDTQRFRPIGLDELFGFSTPQTQFPPENTTFTSRVVVEPRGIDLFNQLLQANANPENPNITTETDDMVIDGGPRSFSSTVQDTMNRFMQRKNSDGMKNNSSNIDAQTFRPVELNNQRQSFSTPRAQFPPKKQYEPSGKRTAQQPQGSSLKKSKGPFPDKQKRGVKIDYNKIIDATPISYIPPLQNASGVVNGPKDKGKKPVVESEASNGQQDGSCTDWRELPLVIYGCDDDHSSPTHPINEDQIPEIIDATPISFRLPEDNDATTGNPFTLVQRNKSLEKRLGSLEENESLQENWLVEARERVNRHIDFFYHHRTFRFKCRSKVEVQEFEQNGVIPKEVRHLVRRGTPLTVTSSIFGDEGDYAISPGGKSVLTSAGCKRQRCNFFTKNEISSSIPQRTYIVDNSNNIFGEEFVSSLLSKTSFNKGKATEGAWPNRVVNPNTSGSTNVEKGKDQMAESSSDNEPKISFKLKDGGQSGVINPNTSESTNVEKEENKMSGSSSNNEPKIPFKPKDGELYDVTSLGPSRVANPNTSGSTNVEKEKDQMAESSSDDEPKIPFKPKDGELYDVPIMMEF